MRFVIAACAGLFILMCDFDLAASRQASTFDSAGLRDNQASPLTPVVELFYGERAGNRSRPRARCL